MKFMILIMFLMLSSLSVMAENNQVCYPDNSKIDVELGMFIVEFEDRNKEMLLEVRERIPTIKKLNDPDWVILQYPRMTCKDTILVYIYLTFFTPNIKNVEYIIKRIEETK